MVAKKPRGTPARATPRLRLVFRLIAGERRLIGPGRAELLERIDRTGSIAAAAREMRMSYRRAWLHVEDLARQVGRPVVETAQGGRRGGGALLSETGRTLLHAYRRMQHAAERALGPDLDRLERLTRGGARPGHRD